MVIITPSVAPVWQSSHYIFMVGISADSMSEEKMELSWELFGELCRALALRVAREYDPEVIVDTRRALPWSATSWASTIRTAM